MFKNYSLYFILLILGFGFTACKSKTLTVILPDNFKVKAELALTKAEAEKD